MTAPGSPTIPPKLAQFLNAISMVTESDERATMLIGYADSFREVPAAIARRPFPESHRVEYCESEAYVWAIPQSDKTLKVHFAVENPSGISAKALAAILDRTLSGANPEEVADISGDIVQQIFRQNVSMGKGMGLTSMVHAVRNLARNYTQTLENRQEVDTTH